MFARPKAITIAAAALLMAALVLGRPGVALAQPQPQIAAAPAPGSAAPADQIKVLEQQVELVLTEARRQQLLLAQMREQLAAAEAGNAWLPWLLLGLLAMGVLAVWLALRVRHLGRELDRSQSTHDADGPPTGARAASLGSAVAPLLSPRADAAPAARSTVPDRAMIAPAPAEAPAALRGSDFSFGTGVPPRPVSAEELLDLDQQVDFFLVLGEAQSAIDLLLSHVRSTGGTYALPYFKLLEIYRQQGDDEAYERTRERFNERFNASAPDASGDLASGRTLEDYPDVVLRLQQAWAHPLRAAAELEGLLLRRADREPFDLPAYREILMLHALVRDLPSGTLQPAASPAPKGAVADPPTAPDAEPEGGVDLLLPLDDDDRRDLRSPVPLTERASAQAMLAQWVFTRSLKPEAAPATPGMLDLDLSSLAPPPREFTEPAAFTDIDPHRNGRMSDFGALDAERSLPPVSRR